MRLDDGTSYSFSDSASELQRKVNEARASDDDGLVGFETQAIPTGQMVYVDPAHVVAITADR